MKKRLLTIVLTILVLAMAALAVLTPFLYLQLRIRRTDGQVENIPTSYYSRRSASYAENASNQLTGAEQLRLVYGLWESKSAELHSAADLTLTPYDAAERAKICLNCLADKGAWPVHINTNTNDWYAWSAKPYRSTDAAFGSFTVFYWLVTFTRFNSLDVQTVCLTDSGNFCFAYTGSSELSRFPDDGADTYTVSTVTGKSPDNFIEMHYLSLVPSSSFQTGFCAESTWLYDNVSVPTLTRFQDVLGQDSWLSDSETAYLYMMKSPNSVSGNYIFTTDNTEQFFNNTDGDSYRLILYRVKKNSGAGGTAAIILPNPISEDE